MDFPLGLELDILDGKLSFNKKDKNSGRSSPTEAQQSSNKAEEDTEKKNKDAERGPKVSNTTPTERELKMLVEAVFDH